MDVIVQRPAALDVHKEQVTACVRFPAPDGSRAHEVRQFKTTVGGLLVLHDWLKAHGGHTGLWRCTRDIPPAYFRRIDGFAELSASPVGGRAGR